MRKVDAEAARERCSGSLIRLNRDDCLAALDMLERAMNVIEEIVPAHADIIAAKVKTRFGLAVIQGRALLCDWDGQKAKS